MLGTALAITAALGYSAFQVASNGGFNKPCKQAAPADPLADFGGHNLDGRPGNVCEPEAHLNGYTYTPHRYPRGTAGRSPPSSTGASPLCGCPRTRRTRSGSSRRQSEVIV